MKTCFGPHASVNNPGLRSARWGFRLAALAIGAMASAPVQAAYPIYNGIGTAGPLAWTEQTNVTYAAPANGSNLDTMNICRPAPGSWAGPYPAVLLIHGGGWDGGSNAIGTAYTGASPSWCQIWASWGFVAYAVGYRLQDNTPGNAWPAQLVDVQAAVRWVRNRAYAGNPDNVEPRMIGAMGDSAGASLALQIGSLSTIVPNAGDPVANANPAVNPQVQFVVSQFAPFHWGPASPTAPLPYLAIARAEPVNGSTISPANSLFIHGTLDTVVDPIESTSAYCYLKGHGNPTNYLSFVGGHEYTGWSGPTWTATVGGLVVSAISFAIAAGHYAPPGQTPLIPTSFVGPNTSFNSATLPSCPFGVN